MSDKPKCLRFPVPGDERLLQRVSLDDLQQLINVVKGEIALLAPNLLPRPDFENYYDERHYSRHSGSGPNMRRQVSRRIDVIFHNKCIMDDYCLRNLNSALDLMIILLTIGVVLFAKGAY